MFRRLPTWSRDGNALAREIFRISDRLDILYRELSEGVSPARYADTWNECRQELDELRTSVADLDNRAKAEVRLSNTRIETTYRTCILQLVTCVDMQIMGCWIAVRANVEHESKIASNCFELARQTSAAYANAIRMVTLGTFGTKSQEIILREFVKSFHEELLPVQAMGEALVVKMESERRMPNR